jgi:hypothetical protein
MTSQRRRLVAHRRRRTPPANLDLPAVFSSPPVVIPRWFPECVVHRRPDGAIRLGAAPPFGSSMLIVFGMVDMKDKTHDAK